MDNFVRVTLNGAITDSVTTIPLDAAVAPYVNPENAAGTLTLTDSLSSPTKLEIITYTGFSAGSLTGVTRGAEGTTAQAFSDDDIVLSAITAAMLDALKSTNYIYQNSSYTAVSRDYVMVDTSAAARTITLPITPSDYDVVYIGDYANTFDAFNCTVARNGQTIEGEATDVTLSYTGKEFIFLFYSSDWHIFTRDLVKGAISQLYLTGPSVGNEGTQIELVIPTFDVANNYSVAVTGGTYSRTSGTIYWTLPSVTSDTVHTITVTIVGGASNTHKVNVLNIATTVDASVSITNFANNQSSVGWTIA